MQLSEYMALRGLSDDQMADLLGVERPSVSRLRRGRSKPSWKTLAKLKSVTGGAVTADDFVPTLEAAQ